MRASSGLLVALALFAATDARAHRREDSLQAARIGLAPDRVRVTLDLTPGLAVAGPFVAALDRDRDGSLSADEQRRYAQQLAGALSIELDHASVHLRVTAHSFPDLAAVRRGEGTIRLTVEATLPRLSAGSHRLRFRNAHRAGHSAYLANALVPESADVSVTAQTRARDQSELTIEYAVRERAR